MSKRAQSSPRYQRELKWAEEFEGHFADESWNWILSYGSERYRAADAYIDALDRKADDLIRYISASIAILAGALSIFAKRGDGPIVLGFTIALGAAFIGLCFAAAARNPRNMKIPPSVRFLMDWFQHTKDDAPKVKQRVAASIHVAHTGLIEIADNKSHRLGIASLCLAMSLFAFLATLALVVIITWN